MPRKRLVIVVLDKYLKKIYNTIKSLGKLALKEYNYPLLVNSVGIQERIFDIRRKKLNKIFYRGQILYKLIEITCLGILFNSDI
jgi:hypothetical protein